MSDEKRYSERDLIEAKREAAAKSLRHIGHAEGFACNVARNLYPLPKVKRRQEIAIGDVRYRVDESGVWIEMNCGFTWGRWMSVASGQRLADLIANPDEEVEEGECGSGTCECPA